MTFRSPYDKESEREQEIKHKAYQRGVSNVLDKIREEINGLIKYYPYPIVSPYQTNNYAMLLEDEVLQIIDKYKTESEEKE